MDEINLVAHYRRIARKNGIQTQTYNRRIEAGWEPKLAATKPPHPSNRNMGQVTLTGMSFTIEQKLLCKMMRELNWKPNLDYKMGFRG
ncbi:MAG: hypothetical protein GTN99_09155 [Candidatus Dadabacteria bacterium]|nr:hypothetical protein [Candidatus Dadabacteria bacterium]